MTNIDKLGNAGAAFRLNGIMECIDNGKASEEEVDIIRKMKNDSVILAGRPLSVYAYAALDLLGVEEYSGNDMDVKDFIKECAKTKNS